MVGKYFAKEVCTRSMAPAIRTRIPALLDLDRLDSASASS